ncbi:MAG TPA: DNA polymerase III subunit gamma/tau, partial [Patescibacteria group bacterium]|nr:DNA polymerase III subunit gamma/tau [Patescibacteria group bacterium]
MSWYRTYRPQTISELNLPEARKELERIRQSGIFQHAYLFTGPKGTGKTSSARILAKMLNCKKNIEAVRAALSEKEAKKPFVEPCGVCQSCKSITVGTSLCVVEMDAASNRGIDDVRALRERVSLAPSDGLVTVYIIDEVHMLTTEAFNALLKVLEEPPRHVVFVLATTELHKVPETILSRCTVVQYHRASQEELIAALKRVATAEGTKIDHTALQTL